MRAVLGLALLVLGLSACGSGEDPGGVAGDAPLMSVAPAMPTGIPAAARKVQTRGLVTVMDTGRPELCLGAVATSMPPQCGGPPITNWDWADRDSMFETAGDVRWGEFFLTGTFDGTSFTADTVIPAALYDAMPVPDSPQREPSMRTERELRKIQRQLLDLPGMLTAGHDGDRVGVLVVHDDGSIQAWADAAYGKDVVKVSSALVPASG